MALEGSRGAIDAAMLVMCLSSHTYLSGCGARAFCGGLAPSMFAGGNTPRVDEPPVAVATHPASATPGQSQPSPSPMSTVSVVEHRGHDTVGVVMFDPLAREMTVGCSTSGMKHKHRGRVGDSPLIGSGLYGEALVGGCVATGEGDFISTFPLCFVAVDQMRRNGGDPTAACGAALRRFLSLPHVVREEARRRAASTSSSAAGVEVALVAVSWETGRVGFACSPNLTETFVMAAPP